jgi:MFS family permease
VEWFKSLDGRGKRTFWACFGGWALDAMDVQLYALVLPTLTALWGLTKAEAGMLGTVALLFSSLGGAIAGYLADKIGRVRVLQLSILWFSLFTFLSGLTNNFEQMLAARALQGIGFGGEWAAGAVLMAEIIDPKHRGKAVAAVSSGWSVGYGAAAIIFTILFNFLDKEIAWRVLFFLGILPAGLVLVVRRFVQDSAIYTEAKAAGGKSASFFDIFRGGLGGRTVVAWLVCLGVLGGNYTVLTWLPTYLQSERGLSYTNTGIFLLVNIAGSFAGYVLGGYVSDWLGRKGALKLFAILGAGSVVAYLMLGATSQAVLLLGFPLGFCQSAMNAGVGPYLSELFPTRLRATGQGFAYNAGRGVGAFLPAMVGVASATMGLTQAIATAAAAAYGLVFLCTFFLPETRGRVLTEAAETT